MVEIFKDIEHYEGLYQISNLGRLKSLKFNKSKILNGSVNKGGYLIYMLSDGVGGKPVAFGAHQLVAMSFLNHKRNGHTEVVDHIDNNKQNNRLDNLQVLTQRQNVVRSMDKNKYIGASKNKNRWISNISINGNNTYLGIFDTKKEAHDAYIKALNEIENN